MYYYMYDKQEAVSYISSIIREEDFNRAILSNPITKSVDVPKKIEIKKVLIKNIINYQVTYFIDKQVTHENIEADKINIISKIIELMQDNFKQSQVTADKSFSILMNKKKQFSVTGIKASIINTSTSSNPNSNLSHNKQKNYILKDGEYINWLYKLNVIDKNGVVRSHMQKKFRQINKFLEMIQDIEPTLPQNATIIDMGCGKSYLTFAMYHYLNNIKGKNVHIRGYDLKKQVVSDCNSLAQEFDFQNLNFYNENIENISQDETITNINMIISLHACNTATDYALYFGIKLECDVILSVPCCQHEVFSQISQQESDVLSSMLSYGILKERFSSMLTDNIRADALKLCGYKTNIIEFIDMEHTPKNVMIKAIKNKNSTSGNNTKSIKKLKDTINYFNINPSIYSLLKPYFK